MAKAHVNGIDLYYQVEGHGEPVLLLAGYTCDHTHWALVKQGLVLRHRAILMDNRGAGQSEAPDEPYSIRQMADDAAGLLKHLGIESAHVAGHSMGGQIAQELALAYPSLVRSLVLLSTWAKPDTLFASVIASWSELPRLIGVQTAGFIRVILPWVFSETFFATPLAQAGAITLWLENRYPPPAHGVYRQGQAILASTTSDRLGSIACPTLVLVAARDILTPPTFSEELAHAIAGSQLVVVPHGAHNCILETPLPVAEAMLSFLGNQD